MRDVCFVFSNPGHHVAMMVPVARELVARGIPCRFVSLAELRGFETPRLDVAGVATRRVVPARVRSSPTAGGEVIGTSDSLRRRVMRAATWHAGLAPRVRWLLARSSAVVVPNDAAFPYDRIVRQCRRRGVPVVLLQEGIRFPLPSEVASGTYGTGGAAAVCCWGQASAEHFARAGVPSSSVRVTGNPRYDDVDPGNWQRAGAELRAALGLARPPIAFLSNPIDDQGFCTTAQKMALFADFLAAAHGVLDADQPVVVKLHPREDVAAFRQVAAASPLAGRVVVIDDVPLFSVLAASRAAVVLASTVGLEALIFRLPLAVLAIPRHGHVFEYVPSGAATALTLGPGFADGMRALLGRGHGPVEAAFLGRHLSHLGHAARSVADVIQDCRSGA